MKSAIFISYRREDTSHAAGRLHAELSRIFPEAEIFIDVDDLPPGLDFRKAIDDAVRKCDAVLVCIGSKWLAAAGKDGQRRLDLPSDFVRLEIEAALARDIPVVPVLVDGTPMPPVAQLPDSIKPLAYRNASALGHASFSADVRRLSQGLATILPSEIAENVPEAPVQTPAPAPPPEPSRKASKPAILVAIGLLVLVVGGIMSWRAAFEEARQSEARNKQIEERVKLAEAQKDVEQVLIDNKKTSDDLARLHKEAMDSIRNITVDGSSTRAKGSSRQVGETVLKGFGISKFPTAGGIGVRWDNQVIARSFDNRSLATSVLAFKQIDGLDTVELPANSRITDLSVLNGLPLVSLSLKNVTGVTDLSPLRSMPLTHIDLTGARGVKDLSPLKGKRIKFEGATAAQLGTL